MEFAVPKEKVGELITDSVKALLESRRRMQGRFTDTDEEWGVGGEHGPLTSMQGIRTVLGAYTALAEDQGTDIWGAIEPDLGSIFDEWQEVLKELEREGYGARPLDKKNALAEILNEGGARKAGVGEGYVDTLSWSVSTAVLFNYSARVLQTQRRTSPTSALLDSTRQQLARALTLLLDAQCEDGGWGWARGVESGHLYFTWSSIQGLADYLDYVLGESEAQIGVPADHEVVSWLAANFPDLRQRVDEARKRALDFLVQRYLDKALKSGLDLSDLTLERRIEPLDRRHSRVVIYYDLYLLESLILLGYDVPGGKISSANRERISDLFKAIVERFTEIRSLPDSDSFLSDPDASTLRFQILSKKTFQGKSLHSFLVQDPGLWAQFLRTMILYRFYTEPGEGPDGDIIGADKSALRFLVDDRRESGQDIGDALWDRVAFNLSITTRSVEALIDVYDYYQLLSQKDVSPKRQVDGDLAPIIAEAVYPYLSAKLLADLPVQQPSGEGEIDVPDLRRELMAFVRKSSFERLAEHLEDTLEPLKEGDGLTREQLLVKFLGKGPSEKLERDAPAAYKLLEQLVWLNFCIGVRLLPLLLAESAIFQFSEREDVTPFRRLEADEEKGRQTLPDRFKLALQELMANEMNTAETRPGDPPSYKELVKSLLAQPPALKGKGK